MAAASTNTPGFDDHFKQARANIFRLGKREWITLVRDRTAAGCTMQRVHVVKEPITDYLRFELTWGYQPNVDAGEDIGIVPVPPGNPWP